MRPLEAGTKPFDQKVKHENETTWLIPKLVGSPANGALGEHHTPPRRPLAGSKTGDGRKD
jgi:hypothetical protein